jgi:hypothetical protein
MTGEDMAPLAEDFVRTTLTNYNLLADRVKTVAIAVETLRGGTRNPVDDYLRFYFDSEKIYAIFEYYWCGETETDEAEFPVDYLWMENFEEVEKARLDAAKEAARVAEEAKRVADAAEAARKREERDRADWERLKARFGS